MGSILTKILVEEFNSIRILSLVTGCTPNETRGKKQNEKQPRRA